MASFRLQVAAAYQQDAINSLVRAARLNPLGLDWRRFVVAVDKNDVVVGCGQRKPHRDGSWELASIVIAPVWQDQGVARAIIERLLANGPRPLWLTCVSSLTPFYARFGFREIINPAQMPLYFRRAVRLFRAFTFLSATNRLSVMRLD